MASQDAEYPAGVSDARLAACQQDVLKMVELAAQVAEGLAANVDPEAIGAPEANTIKEDAAMFLRLADGVQETMAQSRWPVEHAYARSAENLLLRRRLDEMVEEAQDELGHALRTHLAAALRDQAANAARPPEAGAEDEEAQLCRAMELVRKCEETAEAAGVRVPQATTAAAPPPAAAAPAPPAPAAPVAAPVAPVVAPPPAPVAQMDVEPAPAAAAPRWTGPEINKMTVPRLKAALKDLGLATDGVKAALKKRLIDAMSRAMLDDDT
ncbi:unnamed protein product [Pelagomonas calceolata]|uniref:SAP domain-containing protein n=1 Tax=Pelagomonas calceolata TaxID=35677 RepID=A0A8J2SS44_9STRA|nr:unnamed protein product [Pelagomonas calceolata]